MQKFQEILNSIKKVSKMLTIFFIMFNLLVIVGVIFFTKESRFDLLKIGFIVNLVIIALFQVSFDIKKKVKKGDISVLATEKQKKETPNIKVIGIILMILNMGGTILILCTQSLYSIIFELIVLCITFMLGLIAYVRYSIIHRVEENNPFDFIWAVAVAIIVFVFICL